MNRFLFTLLLPVLSAAELPQVLKQPAFQHFYNLEFDEALADFEARAAREPMSAEAHNLVAQAVIFRVMHEGGALDSAMVDDKNSFFSRPKLVMRPQDEKLFLDSIQTAQNLARAQLEKDPNNTAALYASGVALGLRANYDFIVRHAWMAALKSFTHARKFHNRVTEIDPGNFDARLTQGMHTYIAGSLTFPWKQLAFLGGFHGDKETGIRILQEVVEQGQSNKADAMLLLEAIYRREHRSAEGIPLMLDLMRWFPRNSLFRIELAQIYVDLGKKEKALALVSDIEERKQKGAPGFKNVPDEKLRALRERLALNVVGQVPRVASTP